MKNILPIAIITVLALGTGCTKFLEKKQDQQLAIPATLSDCRALLDNNNIMNLLAHVGNGESSADNYYISEADFQSLSYQSDRSIYTWDKEIAYDLSTNDWSTAYNAIYYANTVVETLDKLQLAASNQAEWNELKGAALFFRSSLHLLMAWDFAEPYDAATADNTLGVPLRLNTDITQTANRATLRQTYDQVIADLKDAIALLPVQTAHPMRPCRAAAAGMLARVYLSMRDYAPALVYCKAALADSPATLLDFNALDSNAAYPISQFNEEVIFDAENVPSLLYFPVCKIDTLLYDSYENNDLRRAIFFSQNTDGSYAFKGNYTGFYACFFGIAEDELYLMAAECLVRANAVEEGLSNLNTILEKRYRTGSFVPYRGLPQAAALEQVLQERRKELLMRDLRWMDIKRLNKEGAAIGIKRVLGGNVYELLPNDKRFALPIPDYVIQLTGMAQNPR